VTSLAKSGTFRWRGHPGRRCEGQDARRRSYRRRHPGLQRPKELEDVNFYMRGMDPTAIAEVTLHGINILVHIGRATVLPAAGQDE
jgi:hypothetical protein